MKFIFFYTIFCCNNQFIKLNKNCVLWFLNSNYFVIQNSNRIKIVNFSKSLRNTALSNSDASSEKSIGQSHARKSSENPVIAIVGSGDFGRALALRMVQSGYTVCIGSRNPQRNK